jgi:enoyl-CoA hydratase/carnithine racemase
MTFQTIIVDVSPDGVATVTLNRPEVLNAFNDAMCTEFSQLWSQVRSDDHIRAVVLAAAGERAFCTGVDVTERLDSESPFLDRAQPWAEHEDPGRDLSPRRNEVWKPVIAAVHGMCAGGAFYWVADCDIVVCSPEATFFDPHVTYGFVAALEPIALRYRLPFSDVMRMALLGLHERMTAERALAAGLVTEIVERDQLLGRAQELGRVIAGQPAAAVQGTVKALWQSLDFTRGQALATALMYTQVGNPIGTEQVDRDAVKPAKPWRR